MKNLGYTLAFLAVLGLPSIIFAQTGPGGVGNSTTNPLWLDAHTMGGANGADINSWTDYSGNGNDATETTYVPSYLESALNGRDAINFEGSEILYSGANAALNNATYFNYMFIGEMDNIAGVAYPFFYRLWDNKLI